MRRRRRRDLIGLKLTSVLQWVSSQRIYFINMNSRDMTSGHLCARHHSMHYRQESPIEGKSLLFSTDKRYYNFTASPQGKRFYIFKCWRKQRTPSMPSLPQCSAGVVAKSYQSTWWRSCRHWRLWQHQAGAPARWGRGREGCRKHRWVWEHPPVLHWPLWKTPEEEKERQRYIYLQTCRLHLDPNTYIESKQTAR